MEIHWYTDQGQCIHHHNLNQGSERERGEREERGERQRGERREEREEREEERQRGERRGEREKSERGELRNFKGFINGENQIIIQPIAVE